MTSVRVVKLVIGASLAVVAAGCGASAPKSKTPAKIGIFTSAQDCASKEGLTLSECSSLIQKAIDTHYGKAKLYISNRLCEAAEGVDRCERTAENEFRPRLQAFMVTFSKPPVAEPLYAPKDKKVAGFSTAGHAKTLLAVDETLIITASAKAIAESFPPAKKR